MQPEARKPLAASEVRDYMTPEPETLDVSSTLLDAALLLRRASLRHIPIMEENHLVGILSEGDVARFTPSRLTPLAPQEYNRIFEETPVTKIMTREPIFTAPHTPLVEAVRLLQENRLGCLPVLDDGQLVGIITTSDMLRLLVELMAPPEAAS